MQLLCRHDVTDFAAWKQVFDGDDEARRNAGLTVLQIWRDADSGARVFVLYDVNVREKAEAYLKGGQSSLHADHAGVTGTESHFLETV